MSRPINATIHNIVGCERSVSVGTCPEGWIYNANGEVEQYFRRRVGLRRAEGSTAGDSSVCMLLRDD